MRRTITLTLAALALAGAVFCLEVPEPELLWRFFSGRLSAEETWAAKGRCQIFALGDTLSCEVSDTFPGGEYDPAAELSPFALSRDILFLPLKLPEMEFDSLTVNKTRTRVDGIMCWKLKAYRDAAKWNIYLSGDGLFRVMRVERKSKSRSDSSDRWYFREIATGRDLPVRVEREVEFGWDGRDRRILSIRELDSPGAASRQAGP